MPIRVVLDIPPEVAGGVQFPKRLDQWGAGSDEPASIPTIHWKTTTPSRWHIRAARKLTGANWQGEPGVLWKISRNMANCVSRADAYCHLKIFRRWDPDYQWVGQRPPLNGRELRTLPDESGKSHLCRVERGGGGIPTRQSYIQYVNRRVHIRVHQHAA